MKPFQTVQSLRLKHNDHEKRGTFIVAYRRTGFCSYTVSIQHYFTAVIQYEVKLAII